MQSHSLVYPHVYSTMALSLEAVKCKTGRGCRRYSTGRCEWSVVMYKVELQGDLTAAVNSLKQRTHLGFYPAENDHLEPMKINHY